MRFLKRRQAQVGQAANDMAATATDLAGKTMTIGVAGVLLLLGAAAVGTAATYYVRQKHKNKKAAPKDGSSKS